MTRNTGRRAIALGSLLTVASASGADTAAVEPSLDMERMTLAALLADDRGERAVAEPVSLRLQDDAGAGEEIEPVEESLWDFRFRLGAGASTGNSESVNINIAFTAKRETDETKLALDARYYYASAEGEEAANEFTAGGRHDWLIPESPWFFFADARYDYDEFQSWDQRVQSHVGIGYYFVDTDELKFSVLAGIGAVVEIGSERDPDLFPEALVGADLEWNFTAAQSITASTRFYPDLDDTGEFRNVNALAWEAKIDEADGLSVTVVLEHEHQSNTDPGVKNNDLKVFAGIIFDF